MSSFADGEIDVLVSTTVVEVGVDVPNAALIVVGERRVLRPQPAPPAPGPGGAREAPVLLRPHHQYPQPRLPWPGCVLWPPQPTAFGSPRRT